MNKIKGSAMNLIRFARDVRGEVNRITWPAWADTRRLSIMVCLLAALVALYLTGVDLAIGHLLTLIFGI
jgi:preprotein translocase SecE subunit